MNSRIFVLFLAWGAERSAVAAPWKQDDVFFAEGANAPSSKVDAADLNGDKLIDVVFANGAGFDKGDDKSDQPQQAFIQDNGVMTDVSANIFGVGATFTGRAVKIRDIDYDGDNDILLGTTWITQSQLFLNDGGGGFTNSTDPNLPKSLLSVGDIELGDVDYDGDLDIILANWGAEEGSVAQTAGGVTALWSQTDKPGMFGEAGTGMFEDVTLVQMPNVKIRWSWELEFIDVDNDWDLDIIVSAYAGDKSSLFLFVNDGDGKFADASAGNLTQGRFALDVETIDVTGDGFMDLLTLHDGTSGRNRILVNDGKGKIIDDTEKLWPDLYNGASFDFSAGFYDHDSNGKVDWVLGAIQTAQFKYPDRLIYEEAGMYEQNTNAFEETPASAGTYSIVLADFNGDFKQDVAMAQNENAFSKRILLATDEIAADTAAPIIANYEKLPTLKYPGYGVIRVRAHDNKSPLMLHDFRDVGGEQDGRPYLESWADELPADPEATPGDISAPGQWYGEYLWRIRFAVPDAAVLYYRLCATDAAGNGTCASIVATDIEGGSEPERESTSGGTTGSGSSSSTGSTSEAVSGTGGTGGTGGEFVTTSSSGGSASDSDSAAVPTTGGLSGEGTTGASHHSEPGEFLPGESCGCQSDPGFVSIMWGGLALLRRRRRNR